MPIHRRSAMLLGSAALAAVLGVVMAERTPEPLPPPPPYVAAGSLDPLPYLVQAGCLGAGDAVVPGVVPGDAACERRRPLAASDPLPYRKHDWPGTADAPARPAGYQASDSLRVQFRGGPAVTQTFDFGDGPRRFGRLDDGTGPTGGDGGQVAVVADGAATLVLTEDGGGGVQWFVGPACRADPPPPPYRWILFTAAVDADWRAGLAHLTIAHAPDACPTRFNAAYTRWRRATVAMPFREAADGARRTVELDIIVSEHYGGADLAAAPHLERFYLARDLGLVRWERWENRDRSRRDDIVAQAALIAGSGRCPTMALSDAPGPAWALVDCRTWTNLVRARPGEALLRALPWPPPALAD